MGCSVTIHGLGGKPGTERKVALLGFAESECAQRDQPHGYRGRGGTPSRVVQSCTCQGDETSVAQDGAAKARTGQLSLPRSGWHGVSDRELRPLTTAGGQRWMMSAVTHIVKEGR
jgi:hypothetical protein